MRDFAGEEWQEPSTAKGAKDLKGRGNWIGSQNPHPFDCAQSRFCRTKLDDGGAPFLSVGSGLALFF